MIVNKAELKMLKSKSKGNPKVKILLISIFYLNMTLKE